MMPSMSAAVCGVKAEQAATCGRGEVSGGDGRDLGNARGYRNAKVADLDAAMPAFSTRKRSELLDD